MKSSKEKVKMGRQGTGRSVRFVRVGFGNEGVSLC